MIKVSIATSNGDGSICHYFHHPIFEDPLRQKEILSEIELPPQGSLLTQQQEQHLFRHMNYAKYQSITTDESWSKEAIRIRNILVCYNMRLAESVAKRVAKSTHRKYSDLIGDAYLSLVIAVDKFDYRRSNKFCTYAYRVIYRRYLRIHLEDGSFKMCTGYEFAHVQDGRDSELVRFERKEAARKSLDCLFRFLDRKKKRVIIEVNGLDGVCYNMEKVGKRMGISAERVRQLKERGMEILQSKAMNKLNSND